MKQKQISDTSNNSQTAISIHQLENLPKDTNNLVYMIFLLYGIGALLPWNSVLTSFDFFNDALAGYQAMFIFPFAVHVMLPFVQFIVIIYGHKVSYTIRLTGGFIITAVLIILLPMAAQFFDPKVGFGVCIVIMLVFGLFIGMLQASVFGMGGMLPPKYIGAIMFGNGISGVVVNAIRAICLVALPPSEGNNQFLGTMVYFIISAVFLVLAGLGQLWLEKSPFVQYYIQKANNEKEKTARRVSRLYDDDGNEQSSLIEEDMNLNKSDNSRPFKQAPRESKPERSLIVAFLIMLKSSFLETWSFMIALGTVFVITFIVFPGTTNDTRLKCLEFLKKDDYGAWFNELMISIFNVADTIGRYFGGQPWATLNGKAIIILSYARFIFIATFIMISYNVAPSWLFGVDADWFKITNMFLFAISNGYVSTQFCIKAPAKVHDDKKEQVGILVGTFINLGILFGSIIAIGFGYFLPSSS